MAWLRGLGKSRFDPRLDGDNDLLHQLGWLPVHRRQVPVHMLDHVPQDAIR